MSKISAKSKIYIFLVLWLLVAGSFFGYVINIFKKGNKVLESSVSDKQGTLQSLEVQQKGYLQGKEDIDKVAEQSIQPDDLFSKDVSLVGEIQTLESLAKVYNVTMKLGGLNGTIQSISTVKLNNSLYVVPASIIVTGNLDNVVAFLDHVEHLPFATKINTINIAAMEDRSISLTFSINFYLKQ
jgi:hypothetical protein